MRLRKSPSGRSLDPAIQDATAPGAVVTLGRTGSSVARIAVDVERTYVLPTPTRGAEVVLTFGAPDAEITILGGAAPYVFSSGGQENFIRYVSTDGASWTQAEGGILEGGGSPFPAAYGYWRGEDLTGIFPTWLDTIGGLELDTGAGAIPVVAGPAANAADLTSLPITLAAFAAPQPTAVLAVARLIADGELISEDNAIATRTQVFFDAFTWRIAAGAGGSVSSGAAPAAGFALYEAHFNGAASEMYLNSALIMTGDPGTGGFASLRVGGGVGCQIEVQDLVITTVAAAAAWRALLQPRT